MGPFIREPGTYALILTLPESNVIRIGRSGEFRFPAGRYAYLGSAQGPGGLSGRLRRHLRPSEQKQRHWHIDYLMEEALVDQVWWMQGSRNECNWVDRLIVYGEILHPGFGSSDCQCPGHLFWFADDNRLQLAWCSMRKSLGAAGDHLFRKHVQ